MAESPAEAMRLLKQFEFPRPRWNERVSMLSGGEKRRLQLLSVLTRRPNFLILDEPTNDVDLDTLRALEGYLEEFNGVLVVVSHDRLFTDKVTNHLFVFEGNGIVKDYLGSLSDYAECLVEQENIEEAAAGGGSSGAIVDGDSRKGSYKEDKEKRLERRNSIKKMKRDIEKIEPAKVIILQMEINTSSEKGWTVLTDLTDKLQKVDNQIDAKEMEWLELSEVLEGLEVEEESNLSQYNKQII
jgi:ATP-binding cassette subfamily F protein uup